jgi:hypothetical protein
MRAILFAALVAAPAVAQTPQLVATDGLVYDSLHARPLAGALVAVMGTSKSAITDNAGRFHFDSLAPNTYVFTAQHDALDSAGLSGLAVRVRVTNPQAPILLTVPSFSTLWRAVCGMRPESPDSGFVFGTVRDVADGKVVPDANVEISWIDLTADKKAGVHQRAYHASTVSDAKGSYGVCGVPKDASIRVHATIADRATGMIDVAPNASRVGRVNLALGPASATARGFVSGTVTNGIGRGVPNARVVLEDMPEARTDSGGRFVFRNVPTGTRQIEVMAIGLTPVAQSVDVAPGDTAVVVIEIGKAVPLAPVRVVATHQERIARAIAERQKFGYGYYADTTTLATNGTIAGLLTTFPQARVQNMARGRAIGNYVVTFSDDKGGTCNAILFLDGTRVPPTTLNFIHPSDVAAVEVYPHKNEVPTDFALVGNPCGVIAFWTKDGIR